PPSPSLRSRSAAAPKPTPPVDDPHRRRGAVAPRPGRPDRPTPSDRRRFLDPIPRRLRIHGRVAGRRRAPPPGRVVRVVQGRAPPWPPRALMALIVITSLQIHHHHLKVDLGRSDYATATATQQQREGGRRQWEGGGPLELEPEDRRRGPAARDRPNQLRHVPSPALGPRHQACHPQGEVP
uniref:Uncharacterized protein n=1 Tax=Triticum urartu TaxID=4572 RepID=A0A8R7TW02_TRIUA